MKLIAPRRAYLESIVKIFGQARFTDNTLSTILKQQSRVRITIRNLICRHLWSTIEGKEICLKLKKLPSVEC